MHKILLAGAALAATLAAGSASAAVELINNGAFANGSTPAPGGFITVTDGADAFTIPGWEVIDGNVDWITGYWSGSDGDGYSVDLDGFNSHATIGQTINTVAGKSYTLSFDIAANPDFGGMRVAIVGANGDTIGAETYTLAQGGNVVWSNRTINFTANSNATLITFQSGDPPENCCYGAAIDNVSVTSVPEPTTWALMIAGFGGAGAMLRRRRVVAA